MQLRSVTCDEKGSDRTYSCLVYLGVQSQVFKVRYSVTIDARDCWRGHFERGCARRRTQQPAAQGDE